MRSLHQFDLGAFVLSLVWQLDGLLKPVLFIGSEFDRDIEHPEPRSAALESRLDRLRHLFSLRLLDAVGEVLVLPDSRPVFKNPLKIVDAFIAAGSVGQSDPRPRILGLQELIDQGLEIVLAYFLQTLIERVQSDTLA
jgi:hypothetical protein